VSHVNDLLEEFSEQNLLLQMLLGVLSETERVEQLLPKPTAKAVAPQAAAPTVDPFLAALLGVVAASAPSRRRVRRSHPANHAGSGRGAASHRESA
jgi:hypothetical protein